MIAVAVILTLTVIITRRDIVYSLVIAWALMGIIVKQIDIQNIVVIGGVGLVTILLASIVKAIRR